jgi:hypothetical protein
MKGLEKFSKELSLFVAPEVEHNYLSMKILKLIS